MLPARVPFDDDIQAQIADLEASGLRRRPPTLEGADRARAQIGHREVAVFCSNDYLGLGADPRLARALAAAAEQLGVGSGASRLISGTQPSHRECEARLAEWVDLPASLLFSTGYAANVGALSALLRRGDIAFSDRLNHASVIDGLRLSRADVHIYEHGDLEHLQQLIDTHRPGARRALIVTDAVFSMDGDLAPLAELRAIADQHACGLYVDEAHALGVVGTGRGWSRELGVRPDVFVGTLGKAAGVTGAFVAGSESLRALLENRARSYVYSTAPPAAVARTIIAAIEIVEGADTERARLRAHANRVREGLRAQGWRVPAGQTPIIPVFIGDRERTMELSAQLLARGYFVQGIRPPTVPRGTSRLRVVPTAAHSAAQIDGLLAAFRSLPPNRNADPDE